MRALAMRRGVVTPREIAGGRLFNLDNTSARFRQPGTGIRSRHSLLDRNDEHTVQCGGRAILLAAAFWGISDASHSIAPVAQASACVLLLGCENKNYPHFVICTKTLHARLQSQSRTRSF